MLHSYFGLLLVVTYLKFVWHWCSESSISLSFVTVKIQHFTKEKEVGSGLKSVKNFFRTFDNPKVNSYWSHLTSVVFFFNRMMTNFTNTTLLQNFAWINESFIAKNNGAAVLMDRTKHYCKFSHISRTGDKSKCLVHCKKTKLKALQSSPKHIQEYDYALQMTLS